MLHTRLCAYACAYACVWRPEVVLGYCLPGAVCLDLETELTNKDRLAGHQSLGTVLPLPCQHWGYKCMLPGLIDLYVCSGDPPASASPVIGLQDEVQGLPTHLGFLMLAEKRTYIRFLLPNFVLLSLLAGPSWL